MKRFPHRISVQTVTITESQYGERQKSWAEAREVWGWMRPLSGFEGPVGGRDVSQVSHVCDMYYHPDSPLAAKDRLVFDSENYSIQWIENVDGLKRMVRVFCRRVDP